MHERGRKVPLWRRLALGLSGLVLFVVALALMKEGAGGLAPLLRGHLEISNVADSLGFGWLMAFLVLSGSPAAAAAMALLSSNVLSPNQAFTMITGSRMGASSVVLLLGFIYALREHERWTALSAGVLSLLLTGSIQAMVLPLGLRLMGQGWLDRLSLPALEGAAIGMNRILDPLLDPLAALLPNWVLFIAGVGLVTLGFRLFDQALPPVPLQKTDLGQIPRLIYRPEVMFLIGLAITLATLSVSVSVGLLIPLSARGYIRRENIIPYILGANISTLVDTLIAAALLGDPRAVSVVTVHMFCATLVSLPLILLIYHPYERFISNSLEWITRSRRNFILFLSVVFLLPILLILL